MDLKLDNILWSSERARLQICDFGMSEMKDADELKYDTYCTSLYRPPELWRRPIPQREVTTAVDYWSFGRVVFQLVTFSTEGLMAPPRKGKTVLDTIQAWRRVFLHHHMLVFFLREVASCFFKFTFEESNANPFDLLCHGTNSGSYMDLAMMKDKTLKLSKDEVDGWAIWFRLCKVSESWRTVIMSALHPTAKNRRRVVLTLF